MSYITPKRILGFSAILIAAVGISFYMRQNSHPPAGGTVITKSKIEPCKKGTLEEQELCNQRLSASDQLTRLMKTAADSGNLEICDTLEAGVKKSCEDTVHFSNAVQSRNEEICQRIQDRAKQRACKKKTARPAGGS